MFLILTMIGLDQDELDRQQRDERIRFEQDFGRPPGHIVAEAREPIQVPVNVPEPQEPALPMLTMMILKNDIQEK